jgi:hypothetical protein
MFPFQTRTLKRKKMHPQPYSFLTFIFVKIQSLFLIGCVAILFVACGNQSIPTHSNVKGLTTSTASPPSSSSNGCPTQQISSTPPPTPSIVLSLDDGPIISKKVSIGQSFEVYLPSAMQWKFSTRGDSNILKGIDSEGWYDAQKQQCIWYFNPVQAGSISLLFSGSAICNKEEAVCPSFQQLREIDITVE